MGEIEANARILIIAGSETTATLLSGLFLLLLTNPSAFEKLQEIRTSFTNPAEMAFAAAAELPYLNACISEALRVYPSVPSFIPRFTAVEGNTINVRFVPGNVSLKPPILATADCDIRLLLVYTISQPPDQHATSKTQAHTCPSAGLETNASQTMTLRFRSRFLLGSATAWARQVPSPTYICEFHSADDRAESCLCGDAVHDRAHDLEFQYRDLPRFEEMD